MNRTKLIPIVLWIAVLVVGYGVWSSRARNGSNQKNGLNEKAIGGDSTSGTVLVDVAWSHLPDVVRFKLTDQAGAELDSATLAGDVHAICFFFASCPSICRDLNRAVQRLDDQLRDIPIRFLSISVYPEKDTPEVLARYAADFGAQPPRWRFLTGPLHRIKELGEHVFRVDINPASHTDNIFLIDKWGRFRDRFKWDDATDMQRFATVARELADEKSPPLSAVVRTRNALAGVAPQDWNSVPWIREFFLTDQVGRTFFSRDLTGDVWVASFFFSTCPGICPKQNEYLASFRDRLGERPVKFVSISTDPRTDTTEVLKTYANQYGADSESWLFCRGEEVLTRRIASEYFRAAVSADHHSSQLFVVDRWGQVRGSFDWQKPEQETRLLKLIDQCLAENQPVRDYERVDGDLIKSSPEEQ